MLQFDRKGNLYPHQIIDLTLVEFEEFFVTNLPDKIHRKQLFENYMGFLSDLKLSFKSPFYQWIDGSFVSNKTHPNDIDLVTFIEYSVMMNNLHAIDHFTSIAFEKYQVDAHFAPTCKWSHRYYGRSKEIEKDWKELYGTSREINGKHDPKGLIKINFTR